ncbi:MAG TPA: hypothetical protein VEK33_25255 [Terriglobales bacterium]|nr:hypothetical protein [Terriglobales bacterium]
MTKEQLLKRLADIAAKEKRDRLSPAEVLEAQLKLILRNYEENIRANQSVCIQGGGHRALNHCD